MIAELVAEVGTLWHQRHQARLESRPRKRAVGAGAKHQPVFIDRLLATLVHLRHGATHDVLACWFGVDRSTIARAIGEVRPLLATRGCTIATGTRLKRSSVTTPRRQSGLPQGRPLPHARSRPSAGFHPPTSGNEPHRLTDRGSIFIRAGLDHDSSTADEHGLARGAPPPTGLFKRRRSLSEMPYSRPWKRGYRRWGRASALDLGGTTWKTARSSVLRKPSAAFGKNSRRPCDRAPNPV
ncbi:transposase family protein [Streptomyces sp. NBC_01546]